MKYVIRVLALLALSPVVFAVGGKTFTWTDPTQREDSTPESEISAFRIYCDGVTAPVVETPNNPNDTNGTWDAPDGTFALGSHVCYATTIDTLGQESAASNTVNFTVTPAAPKPPVFAIL